MLSLARASVCFSITQNADLPTIYTDINGTFIQREFQSVLRSLSFLCRIYAGYTKVYVYGTWHCIYIYFCGSDVSGSCSLSVSSDCFLWTHAQRASMLYFADVFLIFFFMRALVGQTAERIFTKLSHVVDIRCYLRTY